MQGKLFIISGPSGSGKSCLVDDIVKESENFVRSISVTTRPMRENETDGCHYHFISKEEFEKLIKEDMLLEWAPYADYLYGTPRKFVEDNLKKGKNVILVIDVRGAMNVKNKIADAYLIFITTSSINELKRRIEKRGTESQEEINRRIEIARKELEYIKYYDCIIVNNNYNEALLNLKKVLNA
jgi:guanylate kinase